MIVSKMLISRIYELEKYCDRHYPYSKMLDYQKRVKYEFLQTIINLNKDLLRHVNPEMYKQLIRSELIQ